MANTDGVLARVGFDHATENRRLSDELVSLEAENERLRIALEEANQMLARHDKLLDDAAVVWQCPRLGMPEKLLWFGLAKTGLLIGSSVICQQIGALGGHYAGSQRSGTRALEGEKESIRGSLKGEGLVAEVDRARNLVTLELRDVPTALKARVARGSDGQQRVLFEADGPDESLFAKPESRSTPIAVRENDSAVLVPKPPSPPDGAPPKPPSQSDSAILVPKPPTAPYIDIVQLPVGNMNMEALSALPAHVSPAGGFGAKTAESEPPPIPPTPKPAGPAAGLLAETLAHLVDQLADDSARREKAAEMARQIVKAVADPEFERLEEFAHLLAHAVCVDFDFPAPRLWRILRDLRRGETSKGGKIGSRGAWFRNAIRSQAAEAIRHRNAGRGGAGEAIRELLVTRKPLPR